MDNANGSVKLDLVYACYGTVLLERYQVQITPSMKKRFENPYGNHEPQTHV